MSIELAGLSKTYSSGTYPAVDNVDLTIRDGEFFVLVGPSGCGKSTLLRLIAGLEVPTSGAIHIAGRDATRMMPGDRDIAMVFQNYALYPHMTVRKNIAYGLKVRRTPKHEVERRVADVARMLDLEGLLDRKPDSLSGGQRQRVAMGRAIIREPRAYLMDEPLSNLDARLRVSLRTELETLHKRLGVTTVYVTHDQVEAMTLGERAAVMRNGVVQQVDTPQNLYNEPASIFVGAFMGSPPMNFAEGKLDGHEVEFAGFRIELPGGLRPAVQSGTSFVVGIRPEGFIDPRHTSSRTPTIKVDVVSCDNLGHETLVFFDVPTPYERKDMQDAGADDAPAGKAAERGLFCARVGSQFSAESARISLGVDVHSLRYFDRASGERLAMQHSPTSPHASHGS